jgi:hypothetical protein
MRNLTELIKEQDETKTYKYMATVKIEGTVVANSESNAGELVDSVIDSIDNVVDYEMNSLNVVETVKESAQLNNTEEEEMNIAYNNIIAMYETKKNSIETDYHKLVLKAKLEQYFNR